MIDPKLNQHSGQSTKMNSMTGRVYKKIYFWFCGAASLINTSDSTYILTSFILSVFFVLSAPIITFRVAVILFSVVAIAISLRLKSWFLGFFLTGLFVTPFFSPNKYYTFEAFRAQGFQYKEHFDYLLTYGVNLANVFFFISTILAIHTSRATLMRVNRSFYTRVIIPIAVSFLLFVLCGTYSSLYISPHVFASIVWLIQYCEFFIVGFLLLCLYICEQRRFYLLFVVLLALVVVQVVIASIQFVKQSPLGTNIEYSGFVSFAYGLDENNAFFRVPGTFMFHNELALHLAVWSMLIFPVTIVTYTLPTFGVLCVVVLIIVLTQSRSVWFAGFIALILLYRKYTKRFSIFFTYVSRTNIKVVGVIGLLLLSFIIIPRVILSVNVGQEGAGLPLRIQMIQEGVEAIMLSPWVGYGAGTNEAILYRLNPNGFMSTFPAAIHQATVQLLVEFGFLGVFFFYFPFLYLIRCNVIRMLSPNKEGLTAYSISFMMGCLIVGIYYLVQPHVGVIEFSSLGLVFGFGLISVYETYKYKKQY